MQAKTVADSCMNGATQMQPHEANPFGNVHGGVILNYVDTAAGIVAQRHSNTNVVTASIERVDLFSPVYVGDLLILSACVNMVGRTSMEVGVRVESEDMQTGIKRHTASAYITLVALDDQGKPTPLPELILQTDDEKRRHQEAKQRCDMRLAERKREAPSSG